MSDAHARDRAAALSKNNVIPLSEPCASCGEKCCNRFAVPLTGFDLVRILERLGGEAFEFAELAPAAEIQSAIHASVFLFSKDGKMQERLLTLQRKKNNYCVFSRHSNGCAIWGFHPLVCRAYPFALKEGGKLGYTKNFVCPRPWEKGEYDEKNVRSVLDVMHFEIEEFNKIVREWNAKHARREGKKAAKGDVGRAGGKEDGGRGHPVAGAREGAMGEAAFWKFLLKESKKKMADWKARELMVDPLEMPSLGEKRGYMERE